MTGEIGPLVDERVEHFRIGEDTALLFGDVNTGERFVHGVLDSLLDL